MKDDLLLTYALNRLTELTGIDTRVLHIPGSNIQELDALIEITRGEQRYILEVDVKTEIRTAALANIIKKKEASNRLILMVSKYIPSPMKEQLREQKISYIESTGNCYIETPGIYVFISDQKSPPLKTIEETKLWAPAGMKFIFALLMDQELLNSSYRNIAYTSGVALGNVGSFINELKREGFVLSGIRKKKQILILENRTMLIDKWADLYTVILRPKQLVGKFRFNKSEDRENWHSHVASDFGIYWGSETAGAILTNYLSPQVYTIYSNEDRFDLMRKIKMIPDPKGEIELLRPFWNEEIYTPNQDTVPPLLAYAELITSIDSRNQETAKRIKEIYVR